jgi:hypothetical protein
LHWDTLMSAFGTGKVLTEAEEMEKLSKATKLTADEAERLERFRRQNETIKEQKATQNVRPEDQAGQDAVKELLSGGNYDEIRNQLMKTNAARVNVKQVTEADISARMAGQGDQFGFGAVQMRQKIREDLQRENKEKNDKYIADTVERLLADAQSAPGREGDDARRIIADSLAEAGNMQGLEQGFRRTTREGMQADEVRRLEVEAANNMAAYDREKSVSDLTKPLEEQDAEAEAGQRQHELAMRDAEESNKADEARMKLNEERNKEFFGMTEEDKELSEKAGSLDEKLRGILTGDRRFASSQSMGIESYEASIKADSGEKMVKKQEEANKILAEIRKNTQERRANAKRIAR